MAFKIEIAETAENDINNAVSYISADSPKSAARWHAGLWTIIFALREMPGRYAVIPEADDLGFPYRSILHHSHRIIFRIDETSNTVFILRVYHGARKPLTISELE